MAHPAILGIGIGVLWIYWVYMLALVYFDNEAYAIATAAFVALIPNSAYTAGVVSNDALIALLFTWAMVPILQFFKTEELSLRHAASLGLLIGLAILAKAQGLMLLPVFLLAALAVCRRRRYANVKQVLSAVGITLGTVALVSGWWFVRCWALYGTPMPHSLYSPVLPHGVIDFLVVPESAPGLVWLCSSSLYTYFWTPFWLIWKYVTWGYYFWPIFGLSVAALVGLVLRIRRGGVDRGSLYLLAFTAFLTWAMWLHYTLAVDRQANLQGRLMLPIAATIGIVFVLGFDGWLRSARAKRAGTISGVALMLAGNAAVIACIIAFYASGGR